MDKERAMTQDKPAVVLVHGAFAESASWNGVIQRLQAKSLHVVAAANPLRSVAGDAAYVRDGEGEMTAAEFRKLLDHPGIVGRSVTGALSHPQLARSRRLSEDRASAQKSHGDSLGLWKDPDPDAPAYREARAEYAALLKGVARTVPH